MARREAALALALAAALAGSAEAQPQTMTPYGAMVLTTYPNGVTRNPLGEPAGYLPTVASAGAATSWVMSSQATPAVLSAATSNQVRAYTRGCALRAAQHSVCYESHTRAARPPAAPRSSTCFNKAV